MSSLVMLSGGDQLPKRADPSSLLSPESGCMLELAQRSLVGQLFWPLPQLPFFLSQNFPHLDFLVFLSPILDSSTVCRLAFFNLTPGS